ncbi:hypothetical protein ACFQ4C_07275 [Larkinella insperata]|uniref:DUF3592 domain-containing protein n=1 Tax=Larkinella insperata TaxID=332158 RepID=A0ABW3Q6V1_9BACT
MNAPVLSRKTAMNPMLWIGALGLLAAGLFLLVSGVRQIQKSVGGPVLFKLPLTQNQGQFALLQPGRYAIWQSGRTVQRVPVKMAVPTITDLATGEKLTLHPSWSGVRVHDGWEGRILVYTFWAPAGQYELHLPTAPSESYPPSPVSLDIRERKPGYGLVVGILLVILAAFCLLTGLILPSVLQSLGDLDFRTGWVSS